MNTVDVSQHIFLNNTEYCLLDCKTAFLGLTDKEKLYAHYIARASWYGGLVVLYQTSPESPVIHVLLSKLLTRESVDSLRDSVKEYLSEDEFTAFLVYASAFFSNSGNYKSFGDTKIIPNLSQDKFEKLVKSSAAYRADPDSLGTLWSEVAAPMYSLSARESQLGLLPDGITCYFSANCTKEDAETAKLFMNSKDIPIWNTRCLKHDSGLFEIRLASVLTSLTDDKLPYLADHVFETNGTNLNFRVTRGDYSPLLALVCENLSKAKEFTANENQRLMLESYIESFTTGSCDAHKMGSRYWIRDKGPAVESYIGFIEVYRDPVSARAEFEGFVAVVNREMSAKFTTLVNNADQFLKLLPWPADLEKDTFLQPDFTSLDVLAFAGSGIPAGINIPNYDEIRQNEGFKNVSLGNVLSSGYKGDKNLTFISDADKEILSTWKASAFEVQVGIHELLGHGSGKLFQVNSDGTFNFDKDNTKNPVTGELISSWYEASETYYSKFSSMASSYEECRAECAGLLLSLDEDVLRVFGHAGDVGDQIIYANWLNMARAGLLALEFYSPDTNSWRQAHMQARYVILQVLLEPGGLIDITETVGLDGKPDLLLSLDKSKIDTIGRKAIADFLLKLQVYKATADYQAALDMYNNKYSQMVNNDSLKFSSWRQIVLDRKVQRKIFVQPNTYIEDGAVILSEYESSALGCVLSVIDRFKADITLEGTLYDLWKVDRHFWP